MVLPDNIDGAAPECCTMSAGSRALAPGDEIRKPDGRQPRTIDPASAINASDDNGPRALYPVAATNSIEAPVLFAGFSRQAVERRACISRDGRDLP